MYQMFLGFEETKYLKKNLSAPLIGPVPTGVLMLGINLWISKFACTNCGDKVNLMRVNIRRGGHQQFLTLLSNSFTSFEKLVTLTPQ